MAALAIINSNPELVDILCDLFTDAGHQVVSGHVYDIKKGKLDLEQLFLEHDPDLVLYDIAPPYEENWVLLNQLRKARWFCTRELVLTTTNKAALESLIGETDAIEILGKPFDLLSLRELVDRKLHNRS